MWNFLKKRRTPVSTEGGSLLASILNCYKTITTVAYRKENETLDFAFAIKKTEFLQRDFDALGDFLVESVAAFHALERIQMQHWSMYADRHTPVTFLHIVRDIGSLSRMELSLITSLLAEKFGDLLLVEQYAEIEADPDFRLMQEDNIDRMLEHWYEFRVTESLKGMREEGRVIVFGDVKG